MLSPFIDSSIDSVLLQPIQAVPVTFWLHKHS